jgi:hypothetical protein
LQIREEIIHESSIPPSKALTHKVEAQVQFLRLHNGSEPHKGKEGAREI